MKLLIIIVWVSLIFSVCNSQTKTTDFSILSKIIKEKADSIGQFILINDFNSVVKYTYPKAVELVGGKENMVLLMEMGLKDFESKGISIQKVTIYEPTKIVEKNNDLQCTLTETIVMKVPNGKFVTTSTLIAISSDNGINWYFLDTADINLVKEIYPNLSEELIIPEKQKPIFYND